VQAHSVFELDMSDLLLQLC